MADSLASTPTPVSDAAAAVGTAVPPKKRFLGRTTKVPDLLGGGKIADLLMWKDWKQSLTVVASVTLLWILFELAGFTLVTILADTGMILITVVFLWSQAAGLLNRPTPKIPELGLSESAMVDMSRAICTEVNAFLQMAEKVALGKDYMLFAKVMTALYVVSVFGAWLNGLTLVFLAIMLAFSIPVLYNKFEDPVDEQLIKVEEKVMEVYKMVEEKVRAQVQNARSKVQKKTE